MASGPGRLDFDLDPNKILIESQGGWAGDAGDWTAAFAKSAWESMPELIGITPSEDTERWRQNNPVSGVISELSGMAVPYIGWARAARAIPWIERIAKGLEANALTKPFTAMAGAEAARFAPFELGRVAISQVVGDKSLGEMATESALNLTLGAGFAGTLGVIGAAGKAARPLADMAPGIDPTLPPQLLMRKIDEILPSLGDQGGRLADDVSRLDALARGQLADRYVAKEISGQKDTINRLFRPGTSGTIDKRRPISGEGYGVYANVDEWHTAVAEAGLDPATLSREVQYPRLIQFSEQADVDDFSKRSNVAKARMDALEAKAQAENWGLGKYQQARDKLEQQILGKSQAPGRSTRASARIENTLTSSLDPVGDGWFMKREPDDGMFVMARKYKGEIGKSTAADKWLLFKTDRPGNFAKKNQMFQNAMVNREKWITGKSTVEAALAEADDSLLAGMNKVLSIIPYEKYKEVSHLQGGPGGVAKYIDKMTPKALKGNVVTEHLSNMARHYLAPAAWQMRRSSRGNYTLNMGKMIQDAADTRMQRAFQGELKLDPGKNALSQLIFATEKSGLRAVDNILEDMQKEGVIGEFVELGRKGINAAGAAKLAAEGKLRPRTAELAKEMEDIDVGLFRELNILERAAGKTPTKFRQGHYGLPRIWEGDFLNALRDESGAVVGVAAGHTAKGARQTAEKLAQKLSSEYGRPVRIGSETFQRGQTSGMPADLIPFVTNPGFTMERTNVRGFKWDLETPTKQDLLEDYNNAFRRKAQYMGSLGREALLGRHISALAVEDPKALAMVSTRFNAMSGVEGEFTKTQNRIMDKVLAPYIGSNSATKIVQATNQSLMHLQLGFGKLSHPITNVIGVIQTVAPRLAFVMNAAPETVAGTFYTAVPAVGRRGTAGVMGVLNPFKVMGQAMKETWKPAASTTRALERAVNERVIDARIIEDYVGANRTKLTDLKGAMKGPKEFVQWTLAASEFMPATSERFARVFSFNAGLIAARDILKMTDEDMIYRFAKQFTEQTNFLYSAADRPLVFTSPLGSSMGLFKNWMMNYMASMIQYTNLGLTENVWSPLMWQTMSTFAVAGAAGTPLLWAAEGASRILADKSLMQWSYDEFSTQQSDALMFGLPAALTGVSLSSQMASPGANPMKDAAQLFSFAIWDRAKNLGGASMAAVDHWRATGEHPGGDKDVQNQLVKAFAPVNIYRTMATQEDGMVRNLSTDLPSAKGLGFMDIMMYRAGLNPLAIEKQMAVTQELYAKRENMRAAVSRLGDTFHEAMIANDSRMMDKVLQQALITGVDISAVMKSAVTRGRNEQKTASERLAKPMDLSAYDNVLRQE